ncbi:MAG: FG-GAP repeat protein [Acidobacteriales bacterium]|nr:FG-GAP repeat protein [Terriglobales bacterium]
MLTARLSGGDTSQGHSFATNLALQGNTLVTNAANGVVYVFERNSQTWSRQAELTSNDPNFTLGGALAVKGDTLAAAAAGVVDPTTGQSGAVFVFHRQLGTWVQEAKLIPSDTRAALFGEFGLAVDGDQLIAGAPLNNGDGAVAAGLAFVFTRRQGVWQQEAELTADDPSNLALFGDSVDLHNHTAVVGAPRALAPGGDSTGAAYIYARQDGVWSLQQKVQALDPQDECACRRHL